MSRVRRHATDGTSYFRCHDVILDVAMRRTVDLYVIMGNSVHFFVGLNFAGWRIVPVLSPPRGLLSRNTCLRSVRGTPLEGAISSSS